MESILLFAALILGTYHALRGMERPEGGNTLSTIQKQLLGDPHLDIEQCVYRILLKDQKTRPVLVCRGKLQRLPFTLQIWRSEHAQHVELSFHDAAHIERTVPIHDRTFCLELEKRTSDDPILWTMQGDRMRYIRALTDDDRDQKILNTFSHMHKRSAARSSHLEVRSSHDLRWCATCDLHRQVIWSNMLEHFAQLRHHVPQPSRAPVSSQNLCQLLAHCCPGLAPLLLELYVARLSRTCEESTILGPLLCTRFDAPHHALVAYVRAHDFFCSSTSPLAHEHRCELEAALLRVAKQAEASEDARRPWPQDRAAHLTALRLLLDTPHDDPELGAFWFVRTTAALCLPQHEVSTRTAWLVRFHESTYDDVSDSTSRRFASAIVSQEELLAILELLDPRRPDLWTPFFSALTLPADAIERAGFELLWNQLKGSSSRTLPERVQARMGIALSLMRARGHGAALHALEELFMHHRKRLSESLENAFESTLNVLEERAKKGALSSTTQDLRGSLSILSNPSTPRAHDHHT